MLGWPWSGSLQEKQSCEIFLWNKEDHGKCTHDWDGKPYILSWLLCWMRQSRFIFSSTTGFKNAAMAIFANTRSSTTRTWLRKKAISSLTRLMVAPNCEVTSCTLFRVRMMMSTTNGHGKSSDHDKQRCIFSFSLSISSQPKVRL